MAKTKREAQAVRRLAKSELLHKLQLLEISWRREVAASSTLLGCRAWSFERLVAEDYPLPSPVVKHVERLVKLAERKGGDDVSILLDDEVHDLKSAEASAIDNEGVFGQIRYMIEQLGVEGAEKRLRELLKQ